MSNSTGLKNIHEKTNYTDTRICLPGTYTGTPTNINPNDADIIWNTGAFRREVSFYVIGFSGFFVKTTTGLVPLKWLSVTGTVEAGRGVNVR